MKKKHNSKKPFLVAITGASGALYGIELIRALVELGEHVAVLITPEARLVIQDELAIELPEKQSAEYLEMLFSKKMRRNLSFFPADDLTAPPASGSFQVRAMIVCPASQAAISSFRTGASRNLVDRAADVCLKEGRPLLVVPREMPLSAIHLENMLVLSRLGVKVIPAAPAFYHHPQTIEDLVKFVVGKILDAAGVEHELFKRWGKNSN
jgi:4-hydroxy-3-polyprenylbenzoate decarboxylase